jgi:hypothetical protein
MRGAKTDAALDSHTSSRRKRARGPPAPADGSTTRARRQTASDGRPCVERQATYTPGELYERLGSLDALELVFSRNNKTIGRVRLDRATYENWQLRARIEDIAKAQDLVSEARYAGRISSAEADRRLRRISNQGHWDALHALPKGSVEFDEKHSL